MSLPTKARNALRGLLQAHSPRPIKRFLWNREFSRGRWDCLDKTPDDCVYPYLQKYANNSSILDLGCGSGSTASELPSDSYRDYTGVDISDIAINKAIKRAADSGRLGKKRFVEGDILGYVPTQKYGVILFRDSVYYINPARVTAMLDRYSYYLEKGGVFIVRMYNEGSKVKAILITIESNFDIVDKLVSEQPKAVIIVFRPRPFAKLETL